MKDINFALLPQERVLDHRFPRPVMEKGYCHEYTGTWAPVEEENRDPNTGNQGKDDFTNSPRKGSGAHLESIYCSIFLK